MNRFARKIFLTVTLLGVTILTIDMGDSLGKSSPIASVTLALGFLLLFGFLAGRLVRLMGGPMITGYIIAGIIAGPYLLDIVTVDDSEPLMLVNNLALVLIAFAAGGELNLKRFAGRWNGILLTSLIQTGVLFFFVFSGMMILLPATGFTDSFIMTISAGLLLAIVATANSPATVMAVIAETKAKGEITDTTIGITVTKDVMVIFMFAIGFACVEYALRLTSGAGSHSVIGIISREIFLSFLIGLTAGALFIAYLKNSDKKHRAIFMIGSALLLSEICVYLGIPPLLSGIMAGFVVENFSKEGESLLAALKLGSLPVFVLFFSLAGESLDLSALYDTWPVALAFVALRLVGTMIGTTKGLIYTGMKPDKAKLAWAGFIGQAGVSLGFAAIIAERLGDEGVKIATLILATVAINQIIGPVLMKQNLKRGGEVIDEEEQSR